jgi:hypothetical protein
MKISKPNLSKVKRYSYGEMDETGNHVKQNKPD